MEKQNLPLTIAGKKISIVEATNYVDEYLHLKNQLQNSILIKVTAEERANKYLKINETEKHFHSDANAFIFSEEMISRFFKKTETNSNPAKFLMVFLGAKYSDTDADKSNPTVVLAGVNKHPDKPNTYVSLGIDFPATEHPPQIANYKFPNSEKRDDTNIEITLL